MPYAQQPRLPWLNLPRPSLPSLAAVVALHVVVIYAFMHVMGIAIVTPRLPTMVRMIPDTLPPPPEPPKIAVLPDMPAPTIAVPRIEIKLPPAVPPPDAPRATSNTPSPPNAAARNAAPPAVGHSSQPPQFVAGDRAPVYPDAYADRARAGRVVVDCVIETTGQPTACRVVTSTGGAAFATETLRWLSGPGHPMYRPSSRDGLAVREEHQWAVSFEPPQ